MQPTFRTAQIALATLVLMQACGDGGTQPPAGGVQLRSASRQIDSSVTPLLSDSAQLSAGILVFPASANLRVGQVVAGTQQNGYLRRVSSVTTADGKQTALTEAAALEEYIRTGAFALAQSATEGGQAQLMAPGGTVVPGSPSLFALTDFTIYDGEFCVPGSSPRLCGVLTFGLHELSVEFSSDVKFGAKFDNGLDTLALRVNVDAAASASAHLSLGLQVPGDFLFTKEDTLYRYVSPFLVPGPIPVAGYTIYRLIIGVEVRGGVSAELRGTATASAQGSVTLAYRNGQWSTDNAITATLGGDADGSVGGDVRWRVSVRPDVGIVMFGVLGPFANVSEYIEVAHRTRLNDDVFADTATAGIVATIGLRRELLNRAQSLFVKEFNPVELRLFARSGTRNVARSLERSSGDGQSVAPLQRLPDPLVAAVRDRLGRGVPGVGVRFTTSGGGSLEPAIAITDVDGLASSAWSLGAGLGLQEARAYAKSPEGSELVPQGLAFSASAVSSLISIELMSPNPVSAAAGAAIAPALRVLVTDGAGGPLAGARVRFVSSDGVQASPSNASTNGSGEAETQLTMGNSSGYQSVLAIAEIGNGPTLIADTAVVHAVIPLRASNVALGRNFSCAIGTDGTASCWGENGTGQLGRGSREAGSFRAGPIVDSPAFTSIVAGLDHACGLVNGSARCWGDGSNGKLGKGDDTDVSSPSAVSGNRSFTSLAAGREHTCGITSSGAAYCWGDNGDGELGIGSVVSRQVVPSAVDGGHEFTQLALGEAFSCGLRTDQRAYCWGDGVEGKLGNGGLTDARTPQAVSGARSFVALAAGQDHACALTTSGAAYCWGDNSLGAVGVSDDQDNLTVPVAVQGGHVFTSLAAGRQHTCGAKSNGEVWCWGQNADGRLGDGTGNTTGSNAYAPVLVSGGLAFGRVFGGIYAAHACARRFSDSQVYCWGANASGQLGYPVALPNRDSPTVVPRP